ncbi:MAG: caspase family protein [Thermoguttaceae bacterium]
MHFWSPSSWSDAAAGPAAATGTRSAADVRRAGAPPAADSRSVFDRIGERYALLIGVRNYDKSSGLQPLSYTDKDVTELGQVLLDYGYRPENVILMTDTSGAQEPRFLPESGKIRTQLAAILRDRGKADHVMIAFSGHGLQFKNDQDSYFCPLDAQVERRTTLISMGDLYRQLESCRAGFKILLCDACRDDPMLGTSRGIADVLGLFRDDLPPPGGVAVFYACSPGEFAREDPDLAHGVFFHFIIEGLRGAADLDKDGQVMLPELEYHAKRRVSDFVRSEFAGQRQMPNLKGNLLGLVALTDQKARRSPSTASPVAAAAPVSEPAAAAALSLESAASATNPFESGVAAAPVEPRPKPSLESLARVEPRPSRPPVSRPPAPIVTQPPAPAGDPTIDITPGPPLAAAEAVGKKSPLDQLPVITSQTGEVRRFEDMRWGICSMDFSPNGKWLAAGKNDRALLLLDVANGATLDSREGLQDLGQVACVRFSPDGRRLLATGERGLIKVWEVKPAGRLEERGQYVGHNDQVQSIDIRPDGKFVLSGGKDRRLHFWQLETGRLVRAAGGLENPVAAVHFDDATTALATDGDTLLRIDLATGQVVRQFKLGLSAPHAAAFSPDARRLAVSVLYDVVVWDTRTGARLGVCESREIQWTVRFNPRTDQLLSGGSAQISAWDLKSFFRVHRVGLAQSIGYVQTLAIAPDGRHVAGTIAMAGQDIQVFRIP